MENIAAFLRFAASLGVPQHDSFQTIDLYERKNIFQVVQCIHTFSRFAVTKGGYKGPFLGPKMAERRSIEFTQEQLNEAKNAVNTYQYGNFSPSSKVLKSARRDPTGAFH